MIFRKQNKRHTHHLSHNQISHLQMESGGNTGELLSEIILGGQDGLVNTLGVILGIAAASSDFRIIVAGGLAASIAEAVSMAAVGFTSKVAEKDAYIREFKREEEEIETSPEEEIQEIRDIYEKKGFKGDLLEEVVKVITSNKKVWLETMMQQELKLYPITEGQPLKSAVLIGFSALIGSIVPITPFVIYYLWHIKADNSVQDAVFISLLLSAIILFIVGAIKSRVTVGKWYRSGLQMMTIGVIAALFGYLVGWLFSL